MTCYRVDIEVGRIGQRRKLAIYRHGFSAQMVRDQVRLDAAAGWPGEPVQVWQPVPCDNRTLEELTEAAGGPLVALQEGDAVQDDPRFEVKDEAMHDALQSLGRALKGALADTERQKGVKLGFGLMIFTFDPGGSVFWISNADRGDMAKVLREWLQKEGAQ